MSDPDGLAPNVAATFGQVCQSRAAALEYAAEGDKVPGGITANCICPGWIETAIIEPQSKARPQEFAGSREAGTGMLAPWHCAAVAHKLTGASIPIVAGWTAQQALPSAVRP